MRKVIMAAVLCLSTIFCMMGAGCKTGTDSTGMQIEAAALKSLAEGQVSNHLNILKSLALTPEVQSGDWKQINPLLVAINQSDMQERVFFMLPDGSAFVPGQEAASQNLADRDYFKKVMAGSYVAGTLLVGKVSNTNSYIVAVPVFKDGKVVGALGTTPYLEEFSRSLTQAMAAGDKRFFLAHDAEGRVALCTDPKLIMTQNPPEPKDAVSVASSLTGWRFYLGSAAGK